MLGMGPKPWTRRPEGATIGIGPVIDIRDHHRMSIAIRPGEPSTEARPSPCGDPRPQIRYRPSPSGGLEFLVFRRHARTCSTIAAAATLGVLAASPALAGGKRGAVIVPNPPIGSPTPGLDATQSHLFWEGREYYSTPLPIEDGLGPIFNKSNCRSCHSNPDGGPGNIQVEHFAFVDEKSAEPFQTLPGGTLRQLVAIAAGCEETLPPEANFTTNRITPGMMGYGLVEAIPDAAIAANADPDDLDGDGISGRVHWVDDPATGDTGRAGRFGWKSIVATVKTFSGDASLNEMGLTNEVFGEENAPNGDLALLAACDDVPDPEDHPDEEGFTFVDRVTHFQRYLSAPPQAPRGGMTGETIFNDLGCNACHVASFSTSTDPALESALRGRTVRPYSDFLLHDMGLLGDGMPQGDAAGNEFRTTPLMGVARRLSMLHDGRVSSGSLDDRLRAAIQAHGPFGEAAPAAVAFMNMDKNDEFLLFEFLKSLGRADFDQNDDDVIDLADWAAFRACAEIDVTITPDMTCGIADLDQDGDVDAADFQSFLLAYQGENGDCDCDGVSDLEEIFLGALDANGDGIPDDCPAPCPADFTCDRMVDGADLGLMIAAWGECAGCEEDLNDDGLVNGADLGLMIAGWGACP